MSTGRVTLPIETGMDDEIKVLIERLGADAVRNSDGTELPKVASELLAKVYATYFPARGDNSWASSHPDSRTHFYLMSPRVAALNEGPLSINLMQDYFAQQVAPDSSVDITQMWQAHDRTIGQALEPSEWELDDDGVTVRILKPQQGHVYTVDFYAKQLWDSTQMYNYLTNDWQNDPQRVKETPYDVAHPETWQFIKCALKEWCEDHPEVDVVRFTTFFYHFTLVFGRDGREHYVDWFGYSSSVSESALSDFEKEYGFKPEPEDFVDNGFYNNPFRIPSKTFKLWLDFMHKRVTSKAAKLVEITHEAGKEAMMFLGDNWIGMEPYGPHFPEVKLDAVVGSVGSAATCRMISDIPGVRYTEGRFLPYFFPDVFNPDGDPIGEANNSWRDARRAIVRKPLDRMGYGGYLSLATQFPEFVNRVESICEEFRQIHNESEGSEPFVAPFKVGVINCWGKLRTWQTFMVAHALWYKQTYSHLGAIESLAGLPFDVEFLSFDEVLDNGIPEDIGVLLNAGSAGTAFSGGEYWGNPELVSIVRDWVANGGGFIGLGEPTSYLSNGSFFQLSDVLGVEKEIGFSLNLDKYWSVEDSHFITADLDTFDEGVGSGDIYPTDRQTQVLVSKGGSVQVACHEFGRGRAVYFSGLPYSSANSRMLHRACYWAAAREDDFLNHWICENMFCESAYYPRKRKLLVYNNTDETQSTRVFGAGREWTVHLAGDGHQWIQLED